MQRLFFLIFLTIIAIATYSCSDDEMPILQECLEDNELGEISLSEASKEFLPYENQNQVLIFSDSLGVEFRGTFIPGTFEFRTINTLYMINPNTDESANCSYSYQPEFSTSTISFREFDVQVLFRTEVNAQVSPENEIQLSDQLKIAVGNNAEIEDPLLQLLFFGDLAITTDQRNSSPNENQFSPRQELVESFEIHGEIFNDVYVSDIGDLDPNDFNVFYSEEIGLVGFENNKKSISLKFERVE